MANAKCVRAAIGMDAGMNVSRTGALSQQETHTYRSRIKTKKDFRTMIKRLSNNRLYKFDYCHILARM